MASPAPTYEGEVRLKFLFANYDGVTVELSFPYTTTVTAVKEALLQAWPERVTPTTAPGMRLLTAGRLLDDHKTLAECRVPKYEHPTPVNVSVLPKGKSYTDSSHLERVDKPKTGAAAAGAAAAPNAQSGAAGSRPPQGGSGGCCVVS